MIGPAKAMAIAMLILIGILIALLITGAATASTPPQNEVAFFRPEKPAGARKLWEGTEPLPCNVPRYRLAYLPIFVIGEDGKLERVGVYAVRKRC